MSRESQVERAFERLLFASRWLMAPFYLGLVLSLLALMISFIMSIVETAPYLMSLDESQVIVEILTLIDLSLTGNLLIMVIFSGYENFVSKMDVSGHPDRPAWMGKIDFSGMKLKLVASIVAISAIQLLKAFMSIDSYSDRDMTWLLVIHLTFVVSGVLLALMDWIIERNGPESAHAEHS